MSGWVSFGEIELPTDAQVETLIDARKGIAGGLAALDVDGKLAGEQMPASAAVFPSRALADTVHASHHGPQVIMSDGVLYDGGIAAVADGSGDAAVVVNAVDVGTRKQQTTVVARMLKDDHTSTVFLKADGAPGVLLAVGHQTTRRVHYRVAATKGGFSEDNLSELRFLQVPAPDDAAGGTTTYLGSPGNRPLNRTYLVDGYADWIIFTRVAWHWYAAVVRHNFAAQTLTVLGEWRDFITARSVGAAQPGGDQIYLNISQRANGTIDVAAFGHPTLAEDRNVYVTTIDPATLSVGGGIANLGTGVGFPLRRNQMEVAYVRPANTNQRFLGIGGRLKRQLLIARWDTSPQVQNNRYLSFERGADPAVPGLQMASNGYAASADRDTFDTTDVALRLLVVPTSLTPASPLDLASKWLTTGNQRSWRLILNTNGTVALSVSSDGTNPVSRTSSVPLPAGTKGVGVDYVASTGLAKFYVTTDGTTWVQLGADVTGAATVVYAGTASLQVGRFASGSNSAPGIYQRLTLRATVGGPIVADIDFTRGWANGDTVGTTRTDYVGNAWALQAGTLVIAPEWLLRHDFGPTGEPVGYNPDIQYIADASLMPEMDDAVLLSRQVGDHWETIYSYYSTGSASWVEELLASTAGSVDKFFRPRPAFGASGSVIGTVSRGAYSTYTDYDMHPHLLVRGAIL